jgi:hypothetical protein
VRQWQEDDGCAAVLTDEAAEDRKGAGGWHGACGNDSSGERPGDIAAARPFERAAFGQKEASGWLWGGESRAQQVSRGSAGETYLYLVEVWERACKRRVRN